MVRLKLSFNSEIYDPITGIMDVTHPILDVGSSYCVLKSEVRDWLETTISPEHDNWSFGINNNGYYLDFCTETHYNWFAMRWL